MKEVKRHYTEIMNQLSGPGEKLKVFNPDGPYLATKKIGKHNPLEKIIREDNKVRDEWNKQVNVSLKYGVPAESMKEMKQSEIIEPIREAMQTGDGNHSAFRQIVLRAAATARNCAKQFYFADPEQRKSMIDSIKEFIAKCRAPGRKRTVKNRDEQGR